MVGSQGVPVDARTGVHAICPTDSDVIVPKREGPRRQLDKQSTEYILKTGLAGGLAGCAVRRDDLDPLQSLLIRCFIQAKTVVGPLDRVKILFQASNPQFAKYTGSWFGVVTAMRDIYRVNGTKGLFRGHSATLLRIFPYAGIKFLAYEQVRAVMIRDRSQETPVRRFLSGSLAGTLSVFFTYPLEVIRVRLAFETKNDGRSSLSSICKQIYNERPALPTASTGISAFSSAQPSAAAPWSGLASFYRGFTPTLWGMLPYAGASFLTHDMAGDFLRHPRIAQYSTLPRTAERSKDPNKPAQLTSWAELTAGGVAGFVSQTISYPLEVIRRRMQVGAVVGDGHRLGIAEVARDIFRERGWRGFFIGLGIGYVKVVPMVATSFYVYERGKYYLSI